MPFIYTPSPHPVAATETAWNWNWATLAGPDAQDFLHRVTTGDARNLEVGGGGRACFLTPQGKLRAYFHVWRYGVAEFALEFDGGNQGHWRDSLFTAIDQYTFAEQMTLVPVTGLECRWIFAEDDAELARIFPNLKALHTIPNDEEIRVCHQGSLDFGRPWVTVWGRPTRLAQWVDRVLGEGRTFSDVSPETLESWRVEALRPRFDRELTENTVPLEVGLTDAIASNKGCYPGQEVIEKIVSLGSPAKRLALIDLSADTGATPLHAGDVLMNTGEPASEVGALTTVLAGTPRQRSKSPRNRTQELL